MCVLVGVGVHGAAEKKQYNYYTGVVKRKKQGNSKNIYKKSSTLSWSGIRNKDYFNSKSKFVFEISIV